MRVISKEGKIYTVTKYTLNTDDNEEVVWCDEWHCIIGQDCEWYNQFNMTFEEFEAAYLEGLDRKDKYVRNGQFLMNFLSDKWHKEYKRITGIDFNSVDCFYNDRIIPSTLKHLKQIWDNYPN